MTLVILIGTNHSIQRDKDCTDFKIYINNVVQKHKVQAIAEEIDKESTAFQVANEHQINYLIIEPTPEERKMLEIPSLSEIESSIFFDYDDTNSQEAISDCETRKQEAYRAREKEWLKRIQMTNTSPILAICGAAHFNSFKALLTTNGIKVIEQCQNWK